MNVQIFHSSVAGATLAQSLGPVVEQQEMGELVLTKGAKC